MNNSEDAKTHPAPPSFTEGDVVIESINPVYRGFFKMDKVKLRHRLFAGGWSQSFSREIFLRGNAVAAVIYDPKHKLIGLIEQFRIGALHNTTGPWLLEVVAGMNEPGETADQVIRRELLEEAGIEPRSLLFICDYYSSPGGSDESLSLFCALADLDSAGGLFGLEQESEDIRLLVLPEQTVFDNLYSGRFNNAATLIALQWLQQHRARLEA